MHMPGSLVVEGHGQAMDHNCLETNSLPNLSGIVSVWRYTVMGRKWIITSGSFIANMDIIQLSMPQAQSIPG